MSTHNPLTRLVATVAAAGLVAMPASAAEMSICTWLPPSHPMNADFLPQFIEQLSAASNGSISGRLEYFQGHPKLVFDEVEDGNCDVGWSFHGYYPGRFILTKMAELPLLGAHPEQASAAYWDVHQSHLATADEHDGLRLLALFTHGPGQIQLNKPIDSLADMAGKKIRVGGGIQGDIGGRMGVSPVAAPGSKVYEIISTGVADGTFMPIGEQNTLKLAEVAKYLYLLPDGMYLGSFGVFMSPAFYDSLSAAERAAVDRVAGGDLSALAGRIWGDNDDAGLAAAKAAGNTVVELPAADQRKFADMVADIPANWHTEAAARGVDTKAALAKFQRMARGG